MFRIVTKTVLITLLSLSAAILTANPATAWQTFIERNEEGQEVSHHFYSEGKRHELKTELSNGFEYQTYILDDTGETISWQYEDTSRNMLLSASLSPDREIHLRGKYQGKSVNKVFKINEQPWNQRFQQGLDVFLRGDEEKTVFWAIGTRGKGEMKITRFTVKRQQNEPPPLALQKSGFGGPYQHIKISLHGILSMFWSGHYWYDAQSAGFLFYQGSSSHLDGDVILIKAPPPAHTRT